MRRRITLAVLITVLSLIAAACGDDDDTATTTTAAAATTTTAAAATTTTAAAEPIVVGVLEDNAGGAAFYSQTGSSTIRVAFDEINASGGLLGRPVELIFASDDNDPTQSPIVVRQLIDRGAEFIILNSGSSGHVESKPVLQETQVVGLAPLSVNTNIGLPPDNDFSFLVPNPITDIGAVYAAAFTAQGYQTVAIYRDDSPTIDFVTELLTPSFTDVGIEIVADEVVPLDALDVTAQLQRIIDADADAVFVSSLGGQPEVLLYNAAQSLGFEGPFFSIASIGNQPETWDLADPGALEGVVFAGSISADNARATALDELLTAELPGYKGMTAYHAQTWDGVNLLAMAVEKAGSTDGPALKAALETISDYPATFGQPTFTLSFSPEKHIATDGLCGLVLVEFGADNTPGAPWSGYQPDC